MQEDIIQKRMGSYSVRPGLEVIKLRYSLRLKIKRNGWLLADMYAYTVKQMKVKQICLMDMEIPENAKDLSQVCFDLLSKCQS